MHDLSRMQIKQTSQKLIHEIPIVLVRQHLLRMNQSVQICLHLFGDDIDILIVGHMRGFLDINEFDYVLVIEEFCQVSYI